MSLIDLEPLLGRDPYQRSFKQALDAGLSSRVSDLCEEVGPGVLAFPLLKPKACKQLLKEIDARGRELPAQRQEPNSMHQYGRVLGELGLQSFLHELRLNLVAPLSELAFGEFGASQLDGEYGFMAEYGSDADDELGFHVDDSAVTLNLCLQGGCSGSELYFRGARCDLHRQQQSSPNEDFEYRHEAGVAILHAGRHRHGVHPILRGRRRSLILWCQSATAKAAAQSCQAWCGAHEGNR